MKKLLVIVSACLLSSCTTISTRTCADALRVVNTAEQIAAVLVGNGIAVEQANKVASALLLGRIGIATACAVVPNTP